MKKFCTNKIYMAYLLMIVIIIVYTPVYAYLDPGTGSYMIQVIAAVVLTAGGFISIFKNKIKGIFVKNKNTELDDENESTDK